MFKFIENWKYRRFLKRKKKEFAIRLDALLEEQKRANETDNLFLLENVTIGLIELYGEIKQTFGSVEEFHNV